MKQVWVTLLAFSLGIALATTLLPAQRLDTATYDNQRQVKLQGPVTRIEWVNPRAFIFLDVKDSNGTVVNWAVDIGNIFDLERDGWKKSSVHIGDVVTVDGNPGRGSVWEALAKSVVLIGTAKPVFTPLKRPTVPAPPSAPTPRWPDGQPRLGPAPGKQGYWGTSSMKVMYENKAGVKIPMNDDGLLVNLSDADRVAPFQPWAKALYLNRQRALLKDDPIAHCLPQGGPRQFQMPNGFQFLEQREIGRIVLLLGGGDRSSRIIYTDGRPAVPAAEAVLTYYGTSTAKWEKDTLVVDSAGYSERFWMASGGLPHTEALHLTEKFTRLNYDTLKYEVTVDDPHTYTRPWTASWTIQWVPDKNIEEFFCEDNAEQTFER